MVRARIRVDGRLEGDLQALWGAPMAACSGCGERDGGIGHGKRRSRTGLARVGGDVQLAGWRVSGRRAPSGWEWHGSQPGQGATELLLPRPAPGKMQGQSACRAGGPAGQGKDPSSEGLGGHDLLTQADAGCPAGQVVRHHLYRQPGAVGGKAARGEMVEADAVLQVDGLWYIEPNQDGVAGISVDVPFEQVPPPQPPTARTRELRKQESPEKTLSRATDPEHPRSGPGPAVFGPLTPLQATQHAIGQDRLTPRPPDSAGSLRGPRQQTPKLRSVGSHSPTPGSRGSLTSTRPDREAAVRTIQQLRAIRSVLPPANMPTSRTKNTVLSTSGSLRESYAPIVPRGTATCCTGNRP